MRTISVAILAAVLGLTAPFAALAAGLGRLSVLSNLGAALNAEIEIVSLQPGEEDSLNARVASAQAFREAGIEPTAALRTIRFAVARRDGRPVLRVTSAAPINEPFVDLLVELEWPGGRLVREYTLLFDPPEYKTPQAIAAVPEKPAALTAQPLPPLEAKPQAQPQAPFEVRNDGTALAPVQDATPLAQAEAPAERPAANPASERPAGASAAASGTYEVKRGDTLGEIARANLAPGVSLNQMMIALYRANQDAFLRENINLVRAGRALNIPGADTVSSIEVEEANRLVQSHRTEWEDYRSRLAAQPARAEAASGRRAVTGKIEAKPEATPPGAGEDRVRLSKADAAKPGASSRAARADDAAARERALQEAQSRVTDLEKNVADLQKLLELKNQQLAEMEKKAAAAKPAPPVVAEAPKPAAAPAPAVEAKKADTAPAVAPLPEAKKAEAPKPRPKAAPPPPPPSLLDEFLDNPIALAGAGAVLVLLLGYGLWSWRRKRANQAKFSDSVLGSGTAPSFKEPGGSISGASSQASVSQASGMEAEEVDPIAEADVYMAYGRDAQAEEILREALQRDPNRTPVHAKLLEIYAKRNDTRSFESSALKLKSLTNGSGPDWDKAAALGRSIDPANALYGGGAGAPGMASPAAAAAFAGAAAAAPAIDFDIGGGTSPGMDSTDIQFDDQPKPVMPSSIDFDLGAGTSPQSANASDPDATLAAIDFDLDAGGAEKKTAAPAMAAAESPASASGLDFDLNLDLGDQGASPERSIPAMDLSSISLDLGSTTGEAAGAASSNDPKWQEVATKLDLAKAYEEMGDKDGARELLGEVMKDGDATQKGQAEQLLSKLG